MAITVTHRGAQEIAAASSIVVGSVAGTLGNMLMLAVEVRDPFSSETATGVSSSHGTWTKVAGGVGTQGGTSRLWRNTEIWSCPVGTTHTGNVTVSLTGSASAATAKVAEITGHDTGTPFGADYNVVEAGSDSDHVTDQYETDITLAGATAGDVMLMTANGSEPYADYWVEANSGTTLLHTGAGRPNAGAAFQTAYGYVEATGSSVSAGFSWWTNDASPFKPSGSEPIGCAILIKQASGGGGGGVAHIIGGRIIGGSLVRGGL